MNRLRDKVAIVTGGANGFHAVLESTEEEWRKCIDVAQMGTHYFTKAVLPCMLAREKGSFIQAMGGMITSAAHTATKEALLGFTISVCYDYRLRNIRVNSLCPGPSQTHISAGIAGNFNAIKRLSAESVSQGKFYAPSCFSHPMS